MQTIKQLSMFVEDEIQASVPDTTSTFIDNMKLPIHRWFRYSAGFSADWVKTVIQKLHLQEDFVLFDPFVGSGTTLLAAQESNVKSIGLEAHPFVARIARAKTSWYTDPKQFKDFAVEILAQACKKRSSNLELYPKLIQDCFPKPILSELDTLRQAWYEISDGSNIAELCWLALTAILRICSPVGTSQMELIQPKKRKQNYEKPFDAFQSQIEMMYEDMRNFQKKVRYIDTKIYQGDARISPEISSNIANLVITSPPYANNFDYADATRLEMTFWGEVRGWSDLHSVVRQYLVRSCAQHMSPKQDILESILADDHVFPIKSELEKVCLSLSQERLLHGGKKNYHLMIAAYFSDLARVWDSLRRICKQDSTICFVIGDSAPYGVYVPVHKWLGELAVANGFQSYSFEKTRDRNVKWKNRKHKVPLCEGRLWVKG